ncbi:chitinase, partial [Tremellales sp. Uapishka_1]
MRPPTAALSALLLGLAVHAAPSPSSSPAAYSCTSDNTGFYDGAGNATQCPNGEICVSGIGGNPCVPKDSSWASSGGVLAAAAGTTTATGSSAATTGTEAATGSSIDSASPSSVAPGDGSTSSTVAGADTFTAWSSGADAEAIAASSSASVGPTSTASGSSSASSTASSASSASSASASSSTSGSRYVAYYEVWAGAWKETLPTADQLKGVTHLVMAFANMTTMTDWASSTNGMFNTTTADQLRAINPGMKVMGAFGGWGLDAPYRPNTADDSSRTSFVNQIKTFYDNNKLDGIDLDWEYPVDRGAESQLASTDPNYRGKDTADAANFVALLKLLKQTLSSAIISIPVPALAIDAVAYNQSTVAGSDGMDQYVDFWNVMSYDAVNRHDTSTGYASSATVIKTAIDYYSGIGIAKSKINFGIPIYAKWFALSGSGCSEANPIGCPMATLETSSWGDTGNSGWYGYNAALDLTVWDSATQAMAKNSTVDDSFNRAMAGQAKSNSTEHATAFYDSTANWFWTWLSADDMSALCQMYKSEVGGMMVWSLNYDSKGSAGGDHFDALSSCIAGN